VVLIGRKRCYNNSEEKLKKAIRSLMKIKYDRYKILHIFSYFERVFMVTILSYLTNENLKIIIDENN
jgi:hypothetical protein